MSTHGTLAGRKTNSCTCGRCRQAECDYRNARYRLTAYGRWQPFVDAEPVRDHVRMLGSYGIGWHRVARLAGVSNGGLCRILYGDARRGPCKKVRPLTADKILAVRPDFENVAPYARVDATGTHRRIQALVAIGWPQDRLAAQLDVDQKFLHHLQRQKRVSAATARAVRDLYDQLWNTDPAQAGVQRRFIDAARQRATRNNWPPPQAWDDDYIDSPAAEPDTGQENQARYEALAEDGRWLMNKHGYTHPQAAQRLGITSRHLHRAFADVPAAETEMEPLALTA